MSDLPPSGGRFLFHSFAKTAPVRNRNMTGCRDILELQTIHMRTALVALIVAAIATPVSAQPSTMSAGRAEHYELSRPAKDQVELPSQPTRRVPPRKNPPASASAGGSRSGTWTTTAPLSDPLIDQPRVSAGATSRTPTLDLVFNGASNPSACGGCSPPDTTGDVGPDHYVQIVNATKVSVHDKSGTLLKRFDLGRLWSGGE